MRRWRGLGGNESGNTEKIQTRARETSVEGHVVSILQSDRAARMIHTSRGVMKGRESIIVSTCCPVSGRCSYP